MHDMDARGPRPAPLESSGSSRAPGGGLQDCPAAARRDRVGVGPPEWSSSWSSLLCELAPCPPPARRGARPPSRTPSTGIRSLSRPSCVGVLKAEPRFSGGARTPHADECPGRGRRRRGGASAGPSPSRPCRPSRGVSGSRRAERRPCSRATCSSGQARSQVRQSDEQTGVPHVGQLLRRRGFQTRPQ